MITKRTSTSLSVLARFSSTTALLLLVAVGAAHAQALNIQNREGELLNFEEAPIHPMELVNGQLWVANIPNATVSVFGLPTLTLLDEIPVGLGPVTVRARPGTNEVWVVCQSSGSVFILDANAVGGADTILDTIQVRAAIGPEPCGGEPTGLVFDDTGTTAYCTLSALDQVAVIDAASRLVTKRFEVATCFPTSVSCGGTGEPPPVHAEEPRSLILHDGSLFVLPFESGNGTAPSGDLMSSQLHDVWDLYLSGAVSEPPPDRDLIQIPAGAGTGSHGTTALWRMGTLNFDVKVQPGGGNTTFYVSNVDLNNAKGLAAGQGAGEHRFPVASPTDGIANHRVSFASQGGIAQATNHLDLNDDANRHDGLPDPDSLTFAVPNEMVFGPSGAFLFVACYESHNTAVINTVAEPFGKVVASLTSGGFGPRGVVLDSTNGHVYVYNRADHTIDRFDTASIVAGTEVSPAVTVDLGYDPTPAAVRAGRLHFINAANSSNGAQSCNTCHMDGHWDRIGWDLGVFTGDDPSSLAHALNDKGLKVTQSLRGNEETPPFHWQGDRPDMSDFNPAFEALLGGSKLDDSTPTSTGFTELEELEAYAFSLSVPTNPHQMADRSLTPNVTGVPDGTNGIKMFRQAHAVDVFKDTAGGFFTLNCYECHSFRGVTGTNNQVGNNVDPFVFPGETTFAENVPHLIGVFDKNVDTFDYGSAFSAHPELARMAATGWGVGNNGTGGSLRDFVERFDNENIEVEPFPLPNWWPPEPLDDPENPGENRDDLAQFVLEFDPEIAPATAFAWSLNDGNASSSGGSNPVEDFLIPEYDAGNCEIVVYGWMNTGNGPFRISMRYHAGKFRPDESGIGGKTYGQLLADFAQQQLGEFTFVGVPLGSGRRLGIDRDMDFAKNQIEPDEGTDPLDPDTDDDGLPDGYEIQYGSAPAVPIGEPSDPPSLITVSDAEIVYDNSEVVVLKWQTSSMATSEVQFGSTSVEVPAFRKHHRVVVRGLTPGTLYNFVLTGTDPLDLAVSPYTLPMTKKLRDHDFDSVHVESVVLTEEDDQGTPEVELEASFTVVDEDDQPVNGGTVHFRILEWENGVSGTSSISTSAVIGSDGIATHGLRASTRQERALVQRSR